MLKKLLSLGVIPARYASTRYPGKPLVEINGRSMVRRVYEQAVKCSLLDAVVVATDDERIYDHVANFGGEVVMTSSNHNSGTDRCAEVAGLPGFSTYDIVVNIQGDEPFIQPGQIGQVVSFLADNEGFNIATLAKKITLAEDLSDPNKVKTVFDKTGKALYFSRSPIPFIKDKKHSDGLGGIDFFKHIGIYGFRRQTLLEISKLPQSPLEVAESLEQLRWLENDFPIGVQTTDFESVGIDAPEDLMKLGNWKLRNWKLRNYTKRC